MNRSLRRANVAALTALACGSQTANDTTVVSDSAGVRITQATQALTEEGEMWTVVPEPRLDIGVQEGEPPYELDRVVGAARLTDGSIIVANGGTGELRLFDGEGRFIRSMGKEGEGPGEFRSLEWIQVIAADTILAIDAAQRRVTAFTPYGDVQWAIPIEGNGYSWPGDVRLHDGTFVLLTETGDVWQRIRAGEARAGQTERNTVVLARYSARGTLLDTLGRFPGYEEAILQSDGRPATTYPPWGKLTRYAVAGDRVYLGTQESGEVRIHLPDGSLAGILRWPAGDLAVTSDDIQRFNTTQFELTGADSATREAIVARTETLPVPESRPAFGRILVDAMGLLWISEAHLPIAAPTHWSIVEPGTGVVGQAEVPAHFEVYQVGVDYVLGRWTDALGVQHVRLLELRRAGK